MNWTLKNNFGPYLSRNITHKKTICTLFDTETSPDDKILINKKQLQITYQMGWLSAIRQEFLQGYLPSAWNHRIIHVSICIARICDRKCQSLQMKTKKLYLHFSIRPHKNTSVNANPTLPTGET